ncbi:hypothetical protein V6N13_012277 [Hibiscus sabdariffa]
MGSQKQGLMWLSGLLFLNILVLSRADVQHYDFFVSNSLHLPLLLLCSRFTTNEDYPFPKPDSDKAIIIGEWFRQELTEANQTIASSQADAYTIDGHPGETTGCSNVFR